LPGHSEPIGRRAQGSRGPASTRETVSCGVLNTVRKTGGDTDASALDDVAAAVDAEDDRHVWELALRGALVRDPQRVRALRIRDTLHCAELWASSALRGELEAKDGVEVIGEAGALHDDASDLRPFDA